MPRSEFQYGRSIIFWHAAHSICEMSRPSRIMRSSLYNLCNCGLVSFSIITLLKLISVILQSSCSGTRNPCRFDTESLHFPFGARWTRCHVHRTPGTVRRMCWYLGFPFSILYSFIFLTGAPQINETLK